MNVIEILVPVYDNGGRRFSEALHKETKKELVAKFAGLTAYTRAPGTGMWRQGRHVSRDAIVVYEVMAKSLNLRWWRRYRKMLERRFRQDRIIIRSFAIQVI